VMPDENFVRIQFVYGNPMNVRSIERIFERNQFDGIFHLTA
jgi:hypothetical protein